MRIAAHKKQRTKVENSSRKVKSQHFIYVVTTTKVKKYFATAKIYRSPHYQHFKIIMRID
jgi:Holliday junction resolvase-like predicted endonuclease